MERRQGPGACDSGSPDSLARPLGDSSTHAQAPLALHRSQLGTLAQCLQCGVLSKPVPAPGAGLGGRCMPQCGLREAYRASRKDSPRPPGCWLLLRHFLGGVQLSTWRHPPLAPREKGWGCPRWAGLGHSHWGHSALTLIDQREHWPPALEGGTSGSPNPACLPQSSALPGGSLLWAQGCLRVQAGTPGRSRMSAGLLGHTGDHMQVYPPSPGPRASNPVLPRAPKL